MRRLGAMIPDELDEALKRVSDRTGIPIATLVRNALTEYLKQYGEEIASKPVRRGGYRPRRQDHAPVFDRTQRFGPQSPFMRVGAAQTKEEPRYEDVSE